jgi:hypothetical protein
MNLYAKLDKAEYYKSKYKTECLHEKIVDNFGEGYKDLYGLRNMRVVLHGCVYRGGANNAFNKHDRRDNRNPLQTEGLQHLADEGFSSAVYLYAVNFKTAPESVKSKDGKNTLKYGMNTLGSRQKIKELLLEVKSIIENPQKGPMYLHCWNGWHQSGFISAIILMQFCDYTPEQAAEYWIQNTDGVNKGYEHVIKKIKEFKTFDDIKIDPKLKAEICPCNKKTEAK